MNVKSILLFVGGIVIGGTAGIFGTNKYYQNKYQKQYEEDRTYLEEYYHRTDEYARESHDEDDVNSSEDFDDTVNAETRSGGRMSDEERAEIKRKLNKNWEGTTNYAGMYRGGRAEINPIDDAAESENSLDQEEEDVFDDHQKNKNRPPKIISEETFNELPEHIEKEVLFYYTYDEVMCTEENVEIQDPETLIGDALTRFGFGLNENEEQRIFVMNYSLDTCYDIQKINGWSSMSD